MKLFGILKTDKRDGVTKFAGQTNDGSFSGIKETARAVTGENPVNVRMGEDCTVNTENFTVDFVEKEFLAGLIPKN